MSDDPTEHVQEHLQHTVAHAGHEEHGGNASKWITAAALTAAFLAAFAAVSGALATSHLTQSTLIRIKANDDWNYYQAKSIKSSVLDHKMYSAELSHIPPRKKDIDKQAKYEEEMPEIQKTARGLEKLSTGHLETHETYEGAATMFHIAIAIVAIAVVARRKEFWYVSMVGGIVGIYFFGKAYVYAPPPMKEEEEPPAASAPAHPGEHAPGHSGAPAGEHSSTGDQPAATGAHENSHDISHETPAASHPAEPPTSEHAPAAEPAGHPGH